MNGLGLHLGLAACAAPADPALTLGRSALGFYRVDGIQEGAQVIPNQGTGGGDATNGDTVGVDARDAAASSGSLTFAPTNYIKGQVGETPTFTPTAGSYSAVVAVNPTSTTGSLWDARDTAAVGVGLYISSGTAVALVGGATTTATRTAVGFVTDETRAVGLRVSSGQLWLWTDSAGFTAPTSIAGVGGITFRAPRIGAYAYANVLPFSGRHALGAWGPHDWDASQFALLGDLLKGDMT